jgi:hypothetical protein
MVGRFAFLTPLGEECRWLDYKGVQLHEFATGACFQDNQQLIDWVRQQPLSDPLTCLGDGHDGVWNLLKPMAPDTQRREILDWYHLTLFCHFPVIINKIMKRKNSTR